MHFLKLPSFICSAKPARGASKKAGKSTPKSLTTQEDPEDMVLIELLGAARSQVYLCFSSLDHKYFAIKLFDFEEKPNEYFLNEARFAHLRHPNIIEYVHVKEKTSLLLNNEDTTVSCLVMEYAPYGDLYNLINKLGEDFTEKLARTYFRHLIEGLEYLHKSDVNHFDLKLKNLLIGEGGQLKIADFDLSNMKDDPYIFSNGTKYYRAPELQTSERHVGAAADIYAAGIILFALKCRSAVPHLEEKPYRGYDLKNLLNTDNKRFFEAHAILQEKDSSFFDNDFKDLFIAVTKENPKERMKLTHIKRSKWYRGPVYSPEELKAIFENNNE